MSLLVDNQGNINHVKSKWYCSFVWLQMTNLNCLAPPIACTDFGKISIEFHLVIWSAMIIFAIIFHRFDLRAGPYVLEKLFFPSFFVLFLDGFFVPLFPIFFHFINSFRTFHALKWYFNCFGWLIWNRNQFINVTFMMTKFSIQLSTSGIDKINSEGNAPSRRLYLLP